jgi:hypothetical protein
VAAELQDGGRRLLEALQRSRVWLVSARETEGSQWIGVLHDRLAAEVRRTLSDADAIRRFELDPELLALWRFVAQRAAAWGAGDEGAVVVDWARLRALRAREGALPFGEVQRRWWEAVKGEAGRRRHVRVALCVAIVVVVVAANGAWRSDRLQAVDLASGGDPATGEPLRALLRLRTFHRLDGAQLMAALTEGEERGAHSDRAENVFGVGPVGLSGAELASLPDVIEEMAPYVRGTSKPEALWGALLAAADAARHINPDGAVRGRDAVLSAMRAARGEPPSINLEDGTWSSEIGGTFVVGCFEEAGDECLPHETKREVTLSPYRMRVHEEKVVEYWVFAPGRMATRFDRDNSPAVQVSWYEATAYAAWRGAALPTDAQWEVAARGGSSGDYRKGAYYVDATGDGVVDAEDLWFLGIFSGNAQAIRSEDGALRLLTSEEAYRSAPSHPLGLVHIHGNVGEWTVDWYAPEAYQSGSGVVESDLSPVSFTRVVRGGSWSFGAAGARLAYRSGYPPSTRTDDLGFRLVFLMPVDDGI